MSAVQNEFDRRAAIGVGDLVGYSTIRSGELKCRVIDADERNLTLKVTSRHAYAYPCGHVFQVRRGPFVYAR